MQIGTSWKMNLTSAEASRYCEAFLPLVDDVIDRELFHPLPPFRAISAVRDALRGSRIAWGAQTVHPVDAGAHTGDVSAPMLADLECTYVEVGHAERRRDHGETDEFVAAQVAAVQRWGMTAILCVGETEPGSMAQVMARIRSQLGALRAVDIDQLVVPYEPAWAIGEDAAAAEPDWVGEVHTAIRNWLADNLTGGERALVIYGGSVDNVSAEGILVQPCTNGLFVGRSAMDPSEFSRIAHLNSNAADVLPPPAGTDADEIPGVPAP